ncbi:DUF937 domain-containing protein [Novosphingobium sp.]|uniref:DUF937 domain-containing protein n=1 Tax=Novosphingobium sp. TaxID=1874826 RepID=UPI0025FB7EA0|nr:DUF937 domain-containing protein [Novosphingobium sp.]
MAGMELIEMLRRSGGLDAVSKQLGVPPAIAAAGAEALLPAVIGGFRKHAETAGGGEGGLGSLIGMLGSLGGGALAANVLGPDSTNISMGNDVLGQIFGSKDVSRSVAADAAERTGIDPETLKRMLPLLAMLVGGYLSARAGGSGSEGGGLLSDLGSVIGGFLASKAGSAPGPTLNGTGGLGSMLDMNGNGNPLDDIIAMAGKLRQ